jgi:hypothetical protein
MKKILKLEDLKSWKRVACLISVIGGLQFIIITIIAMIFYSGGYVFFDYTFLVVMYFSNILLVIWEPQLQKMAQIIRFQGFYL